jgi:hypothetical protein
MSDGFIAVLGMGFLLGIITSIIVAVLWNDN